jgi:hypothetical protein
VHHKDSDHSVEAHRVSVLLASRPDVRAGDCDAMALVLSQTTAQLARWVVHDAPPDADQERLLEEILQLLLRYLRK